MFTFLYVILLYKKQYGTPNNEAEIKHNLTLARAMLFNYKT